MYIKIKKRLLLKDNEKLSIQNYSVKTRTSDYNIIVRPASKHDDSVLDVSVSLRNADMAKYLFGLFLTKEIISKVLWLNIEKTAKLAKIEYTGPIMRMIIHFDVVTELKMDKVANVLLKILKATLDLLTVIKRLAKT